jgi:plasmid stability protein
MTTLAKRSTVYFDPALHQALRIRAATTHASVSDIVNEALRLLLREDSDDLQAFDDRAQELSISYEALLNDLKQHGKI